MILLDCGNSSIKAQWRENRQVRASFATRYEGGWPQRLESWLQGFPVMQVYLSSVLDAERQSRLDASLNDHSIAAPVRFVSQASAGGVTNAYAEPERLGVDRWLALIGAADRFAADCLIIDAGSAITLDLLRRDGRHLGGAILPGLNTTPDRFRQIFSFIDFGDPAIGRMETPGCSTEEAIQIDYPQHSIDRLRELVTNWKKNLEPNAALLITGGDAPRVQRELELPARILPDLVFIGMQKLAAA